MANPAEDLDAFLTTVELKLRGPFSSLELTKAAHTVGLRKPEDDSAPVEFLERLAQVLHRTDKITKLRILIALLGFDPDHGELDAQIDAILTDAQESPKHEEWVRVIAGLIQGIMFHEEGEESNECRRSCRGEEANDLLEKTCNAIIDSVQQVEKSTEAVDAIEHPRLQADANPMLAPFRYALLKPEMADQIFPKNHGHFTVNRSSDLLTMDAKQDALKAQEEKEHETIPGMGAIANETKPVAVKETLTPTFPGFRSASSNNKPSTGVQRPKSSMFITSKKPAAVTAKTVLHQRRAGGAQALVGKGRGRMAGANGRTTTLIAGSTVAGVRGRAMQGTGARSRMKMVDDEEANALSTNQQQQQQQQASVPQQGKPGRKRKAEILGNDSAKLAKRESDATAVHGNSDEAMSASKEKTGDVPVATAVLAAATTAPAALKVESPEKAPASDKPSGVHHRQQDWRSLLENKSNRLSSEDRSRVEQFFMDHSNPTPEQTHYKMKLHEERTNDTATGQPMKETYYLELDYTNFTSKQSKKVKRY
jgi:hypothetical protein